MFDVADGRTSDSLVQPPPELSQHERTMMNGLQVSTRHLEYIREHTPLTTFPALMSLLQKQRCFYSKLFVWWPAESLWCPVGWQWRSWILSPPAAESHHSDLCPRPKLPAALCGPDSFNSAVPYLPTSTVSKRLLKTKVILEATVYTPHITLGLCCYNLLALCGVLLPLILSVFGWRQRQVWECVVTRRKSPHVAKEEILEASWKHK